MVFLLKNNNNKNKNKKPVSHILILHFELLVNIQRCEISNTRTFLSWGLARDVSTAEFDHPTLLIPVENVTQLFVD